jgi:hypothetical protein
VARETRAALLALLISAAGCGLEHDPVCREGLGKYPARFAGAAAGVGVVRFARAAAGDGTVDVQVAFRALDPEGKPTPESEQPFIELAGQGTCRDGTVRARLGGAESKDKRLQVLGGNFVAVLAPEVGTHAFGHWQVDVVDRQDHLHHDLEGYFSALDAADDLQHPKTAPLRLGDARTEPGDQQRAAVARRLESP